jgi:hypothetical protein
MRWSWKHWTVAAASGFGLLWLLRGRASASARPPESFTPCTLLYDGGEYATTWGDWLWMARACSGESGSLVGQEAVAWCLLQRKAARAQRGRSETLTGLIRSFSQPVNPIWSAHDACSSDGTRGCCGSTIEACTPSRIAHRLEVQSRTWSWLEQNTPELYRSILLLAEGRRPPRNPVLGYTNFAQCGSFDDSGSLSVGGNCFIKEPTLYGKISLRPGG